MHVIKICMGCSCAMNFGTENLKRAEEILGIKAGESSKDGRFRLEKTGCLSNCENAPNVLFCKPDGPLAMLMVDGKLEENLLPHRFAKLLKGLMENP